ncbi:MAG: YceI family protein [Bacteroidetes bacterium]|nr:YceI family protein [Bacteroidota bacterium]
MKTNKLFYVMMLAGGLFIASCSNNSETNTDSASADSNETLKISNVEIIPSDSRVFWKGEMLGIYSHSGTVDLTSSDIKLDNGKITGGSFTVDLSTMIPTDENYNPEEGSTPEKLVGHLSSPDFFDVENHPTAKFEITRVDGNTAYGMLTVRGKTNEEKVENINIREMDGNVVISGDLAFDRKKYDVSWDSPVQDRVLSNNIEVKVELVGTKG